MATRREVLRTHRGGGRRGGAAGLAGPGQALTG